MIQILRNNCFIGVALFVLLLMLSGCELESIGQTEEKKKMTPTSGEAVFTFFDVGQGDSSLIVGPTGETILVDTGRHDDDRILGLLEKEHVEEIDLLVLTHPHADHIGNADKIIELYEPKEIWMSGDTHTSRTFERVIDAALESDADYYEPVVGDVHEVGAFSLEIVSPTELTGDLNNGSVAFNLTYADVVFLYTGDAEKEAEEAMVESGLLKKVDILKVGHHGSSSSSHSFFLEEVKPDIAIYSAEAGNSYGHPHTESISRLEEIGAEIYGTDVDGTVRVKTDGTHYEISTEKAGE